MTHEIDILQGVISTLKSAITQLRNEATALEFAAVNCSPAAAVLFRDQALDLKDLAQAHSELLLKIEKLMTKIAKD
jgi:hypothetical protein